MCARLESYQKEDSPPTILWPLPVSVIQALGTAAHGTTLRNIAISDLTLVAFFFLLRPGKYCKGGADTSHHPFRLKDVQFSIGQQPYNVTMASNSVLAQADFVSLLFKTQKNGVKGESIGHNRIGHPQGCSVAAMCHRVAYLDATAPPARSLSQVTRKAPSGNRSQGRTSRHPSEPSSEQ